MTSADWILVVAGGVYIWLACWVGAYTLIRATALSIHPGWTRHDRRLVLFLSAFGPISLVAGVLGLAIYGGDDDDTPASW